MNLCACRPLGCRFETELVRCQGSERPSTLQIQRKMFQDQGKKGEHCSRKKRPALKTTEARPIWQNRTRCAIASGQLAQHNPARGGHRLKHLIIHSVRKSVTQLCFPERTNEEERKPPACHTHLGGRNAALFSFYSGFYLLQ